MGVEQAVRQFSRYYKYTLGTQLRHMAMQVLSNTTHAINQKQRRQQWVKRLVLVIEELKLKINIDTGISGQAALQSYTWQPSPMRLFVAVNGSKPREIHSPAYADRVVHHWFVPYLQAFIQPKLIHDYPNGKTVV